MKIVFLLLFSFSLFAQDKVAKVIILKGEVKAELADHTLITLKKDDWLPEGATILTSDKSYIKMVFIDKSTVSVGPESTMKITSFPTEGAGVLSVIKGQIRSQVIKELDKNVEVKTKLFVKTKSAALGVRGTDFQVIFNPDNEVTSLVTFEGSVAFSKFEPSTPVTRDNLEAAITSENAVFVKQGQFSGANPSAPMVTVPTKISPAQFETMKNNTNLAPAENDSAKQKAPTEQPKYVSIVAPGLPQSVVVNTENALGRSTDDKSKPEGFLDKSTGKFQPAAGGFIDVKTGLYIAPPPGSILDPNTNVFIPPAQFGSFDPKAGSYIPPTGLTLATNGEFKMAPNQRAPASEVIIPTKINASGDVTQNVNPLAYSTVAFNTTKDPVTQTYVAPSYDREKLDQLREKVYTQLNEQTQIIQNSQVKINITVGN